MKKIKLHGNADTWKSFLVDGKYTFNNRMDWKKAATVPTEVACSVHIVILLLLYFVCNAYFQKKKKPINSNVEFYIFSQHPLRRCVSAFVYALDLLWTFLLVQSATEDMFKIYKNHVDQYVATKSSDVFSHV